MKKHLISKIAATAVMAILCSNAIFGITVAQAQECPTSILPPGCSWGGSNGAFNVPIPGTTCTVQIIWCYVCCNGQNYFYISGMTPLSGDCDDVDPQLMENAATKFIFNTLALWGCTPCPNGSTVVTVGAPTCWVKNGISGAYTFSGCGTSTCYCQLSATVTCINGVVILSACTSSTIGTCGTCTADPGASNLWMTGTCYSLSCPPAPC
jgi:hypothetical protein